MSEYTRNELFRLAECTVHPLRASLSRKLRIRTELFEHLETIYEDEFKQLRNEQAALAQVRARFGDPTELSRETQKSLPPSEPLRYFLEQQCWKPGESVWHFLGKHLCSAVVVWGIGLLLTILLLLMAPNIEVRHLRSTVRMITSMAIVLTVFSTTIILSLTQFSRSLHSNDKSKTRWQTVARCGVQFLLTPTILVLVVWSLMLSELDLPLLSNFGQPQTVILAICSVASLTMSLFFQISRQVADEKRYEKEWANLLIED
jgi:hypothetical protein